MQPVLCGTMPRSDSLWVPYELPRRVSPVPNQTVCTFRHPYAEEFVARCASKVFPRVHGLRQVSRGSALPCPLSRVIDDAAVFALCCGLRTCSAPF